MDRVRLNFIHDCFASIASAYEKYEATINKASAEMKQPMSSFDVEADMMTFVTKHSPPALLPADTTFSPSDSQVSKEKHRRETKCSKEGGRKEGMPMRGDVMICF